MTENHSSDWSLTEWSDLFSDPAASLSGLKKGIPFGPGLSPSIRLALWFELFLLIGGEGAKSQLASLPEEELLDLGIRLLQCYLSQPLYIRIFHGQTRSIFRKPLNFKAQGKLYLVEQGMGEKNRKEILYPLDHRRLWPEALRLLPDRVFASDSVYKTLEPAIRLSSSSRLEKIRMRGETLSVLFREGRIADRSTILPDEAMSLPPPAAEEGGGKGTLEIKQVATAEATPIPSLETQGPVPPFPHPPGKKKKRKSSQEQLELF